jgi:hypothetical protein
MRMEMRTALKRHDERITALVVSRVNDKNEILAAIADVKILLDVIGTQTGQTELDVRELKSDVRCCNDKRAQHRPCVIQATDHRSGPRRCEHFRRPCVRHRSSATTRT